MNSEESSLFTWKLTIQKPLCMQKVQGGQVDRQQGKKGFQDTSGLLSCHAEGRYETEELEQQSVTMSPASDCTSFPSEHCHLTQDGMKEREAHGLLITAPPVDAQQ